MFCYVICLISIFALKSWLWSHSNVLKRIVLVLKLHIKLSVLFENLVKVVVLGTFKYLKHALTYTTIFDIPIFDYANKLYLISKQGSAIHTNIGSQEYSPSIIASIDTVIRKGLPVIVNFETYGKPIKNRINIDSFHYIELELVDMMLNPVVLLSPMFVSIKVKPCNTPIARLTD